MAGQEPCLCLALFQSSPTSRRQPTFSILIGWIHPNLFGELCFANSVLPEDWDVPEEHSSAADPQRRRFSRPAGPWDFPSNTGLGCHFFLQGSLRKAPTLGSIPGAPDAVVWVGNACLTTHLLITTLTLLPEVSLQ